MKFNPFNAFTKPAVAATVVAAADEPTVVAIPTSNIPTDTSATEQFRTAVAADRQCTLTIGKAQELFVALLRRPLSPRSLQRYCQNGTILAQLISHSQGKEWLINEASLTRFIERYPITKTDAGYHDSADTATPQFTTAPLVAAPQPTYQTPPAATALHLADTTDTTDTDDDDSPANDSASTADVFVDPATVGERREIGALLIENARLTAIIEGQERLIAELKKHDERTHQDVLFSRGLITKLTDDVKNINSQMLDTMVKMRNLPTAGNDDDSLTRRFKS